MKPTVGFAGMTHLGLVSAAAVAGQGFKVVCFDGDQAHCREGYEDAEGVLTHLDNVGPLLEQALKIADLSRLEIHGPEGELSKLREPLGQLHPQFFVLEYGFRR